MKIALVHDYLTQRGGAERIFAMLCSFFPQGDIYTSIYRKENTVNIEGREVNTTFLQDIPGVTSYFRLFAPFYYPAFRSLDLQEYDLIISSSSSFAKAVRKKPGAMHICFCHNVTRFLWDTKTYLKENSTYQLFSPLINQTFNFIRQADFQYAQEPDLYIANSTTVAERIKRLYKRSALTVNYPIDPDKFVFSNDKDEYYLISSRMISYKRLDIVIEAFNWLGWPLIIIGDGPERKRLESLALENIKFLGYVEDELRSSLMAKAKGVIVMALEDYGLVPIEANASGTPVIAYGAGGVLDTQVDGVTGILFSPQTPEALHDALFKAEQTRWDYQKIRNHAVNNFSEKAFLTKIKQLLGEFYGSSALDFFRKKFS